MSETHNGSAGLSEEERQKLEEMARGGRTFVPMGKQFDRITRTACRLFNVPQALVSIVERDLEWFKTVPGLTIDDSGKTQSFSSWVVATGKPFIVPDTQKNRYLANDPLVVDAPRIRFFAGYPLYLGPGLIVGSLCLMDQIPRQLSEVEEESLADMAGLAEAELRALSLARMQANLRDELSAAEKRTMTDPVTGCWTKTGIMEVMNRELRAAALAGTKVGLLLVEFAGLARINQQHGLAAGDFALARWAQTLRAAMPDDVPVGNMGGARFLVMLSGRDAQRVSMFANSINTLNANASDAVDGTFTGVTVGRALFDGATRQRASIADLLQSAEEGLRNAQRSVGSNVT
jgi:diguanylate cyclase (GGDEF)-like protein